MTRFIFVFLSTFCTCYAAKDPPTVNIPNQGTIVGREVSKLRIQRITGYYGIPYAQPPIANLRFAPPVTDPLPFWEGERNSTDYYPSCLQTKEDFKQSEIPFLQLLSKDLEFGQLDEDCLYLNVFVPQGEFLACFSCFTFGFVYTILTQKNSIKLCSCTTGVCLTPLSGFSEILL